jgi:hypothetical protein
VRGLLVVVALAAVGLTACTGGATDNPTVTSTVDETITSTVTHTPSAGATFKPKPATTVAPLPPGQAPAAGEVEKACPYILSSQDQGPVSMADLEGDRVYRTTVLTGMKPVGCRFYFWSDRYQAIAEIATQTFPSSRAAHDAMVLTAQAGKNAQGYPNLLKGIDAVSYQTKFLGGDGDNDWACVFAKGKLMVTVRTQRIDTSLNARLIAEAIAPRM